MRLLLILIVSAIIQYSGFSQTNISLHGGINVSNIEGPLPYQNQDNIQLPFGGLSIRYELSERINMIFMWQYSLKGHGEQHPFSSAFLPKKRFHYGDLLPTLEVKLAPPIGVYAGGNIGYLIKIDSYTENVGWTKEDTGIWKEWDYGWLVGVRLYLGNMALQAHYNKSLFNMNEFNFTDDQGSIIEDVGLKNKNIQIGITFYL